MVIDLEAEESTFAIALVLAEVSEATDGLKKLWSEWAVKKVDLTTDDDKGAEFLAVAACTEYTVSALSKYFGQVELEYSF
jgi:hypothetical protein